MYKTYVLSVTPRANIEQVGHIVQTDRRIVAYWNYLQLVFCVKTQMSAKELAELFEDAAVHAFLVAEIDPTNVNGRLQRAAWEWFKEPVEVEEAVASGFRES
jgi:hypothetical protein